jgi:hypothetical protein
VRIEIAFWTVGSLFTIFTIMTTAYRLITQPSYINDGSSKEYRAYKKTTEPKIKMTNETFLNCFSFSCIAVSLYAIYEM